MRRAFTTTVLPAAATLLLGAALATAQRAEPATIPTALARSIMGSLGAMLGTDPRFTSDTPAGWPASLVPRRPATAVGGVAIGPLSVALFRYPGGTDAVASFERMLLGAGYTRDTIRQPTQGGFVSVPVGPAMDYCHGTSGASITRDSIGHAPIIRVMLVDGAHLQSPCHPRARATDLSEIPLELPALRPPRGTEAQRQGYDMRVGAFNLSVRLDTLVRADSVLAHYVAQLQHAGWRLSGTGVHSARVASQELSATDRNGHGWRGTLIAWFVDTSQHVQLSMQSVRE